MRLRSLICWCLIVLVPLSAWPQSQPLPVGAQGQGEKLRKEDQSGKVKRQVEQRGTGQAATVKVTLRNKLEVSGYISQIDADSFQVTEKKSGRVTTIAYQEVEKVRKPGLSTGAKIAIVVVAAGAIAGSLAATLPKD